MYIVYHVFNYKVILVVTNIEAKHCSAVHALYRTVIMMYLQFKDQNISNGENI